MNAVTRKRLLISKRLFELATANPIDDPSFSTTLKRMGDAIAQADTMAGEQSQGTANQHGAVSRRNSLKREIRQVQLHRLVRVGALAVVVKPELAKQFELPDEDLPNQAFLVASRRILATVTANNDLLVSLGLGTTFTADLGALLDAFEEATTSEHAGLNQHVGATTNLNAVMRECMRDADLLRTFYRAKFPAGSDLLNEWASALRAEHPLQPGRGSRTPEPVPAPAPTPKPEGDE